MEDHVWDIALATSTGSWNEIQLAEGMICYRKGGGFLWGILTSIRSQYGSVIIGTESRDISREIYVTLARSFLVVLGSSPLWEKINRFVRCLWKRCCRIQWWNQELNSRGWRKSNRIICNYLKIALKVFASNGRKWLIRLSGVFGNYWLQWWIIFIEELRGYWNGHSKNEKRVCDFRICRDCLFKVKKKKYCWL